MLYEGLSLLLCHFLDTAISICISFKHKSNLVGLISLCHHVNSWRYRRFRFYIACVPFDLAFLSLFIFFYLLFCLFIWFAQNLQQPLLWAYVSAEQISVILTSVKTRVTYTCVYISKFCAWATVSKSFTRYRTCAKTIIIGRRCYLVDNVMA